DLTDAVLKAARPGDVIMVKGSNSIRMGNIVKALKERFADSARAAASKG
ncbi:MAG: UDP-N-acetylmuramoylalanyl-D-glutamyl-2, 6-diaminopimelate--D-alanyl-D-alanine ligase, partial [Pseudomonadota bacterium]|nr:UDP-N-acetylmuramoylalanyl-D-glutamyl-2, 6-diaminopimelate--D-alanyl-D-alanine ligase [Pseudomonadota bacterium]